MCAADVSHNAEYVCMYCREVTPFGKRSACCGDAIEPARPADLVRTLERKREVLPKHDLYYEGFDDALCWVLDVLEAKRLIDGIVDKN